MDTLTGTVFDIQRCSLHDGPGVRTTVFLKGCPLRCLWCHNPESMDPRPEISFAPERCVGCGACAEVCPEGCHVLENGVHRMERGACVRCGRCAQACAFEGLRQIGRLMTVDAVMAEVLRDRRYFEGSGGGLTLSGGEPFAQPLFSLELLRRAKAEGLHTCVETSGMAAFHHLEEAAPYVDLWLYDCKETDPQRHRAYTGADNRLIRENLEKLSGLGATIRLRCPIIPTLNDRPDHFSAIGRLADRLPGVQSVQIMPYHPFASAKRARIGRDNPLEGVRAPDALTRRDWQNQLAAATRKALGSPS